MTIDYSRLSTEQINPRSKKLDALTPRQIVRLMSREETRVVRALQSAEPAIAKGIEMITASFRMKRNLFFVGAGTSGRLGVIEAAECPPTFGSSPSKVRAFMAGGKKAVFRSQEGAEDNEGQGRLSVEQSVRAGDVVVGIAASGVTSFVRGALAQARKRRAKTILLTCNHALPTMPFLDHRIVVLPGPEILTGSTRLKAGTACKLVLNILTTASFIGLGKVYGNRMVDLQPKSKKLVARGERLVEEIGGVSSLEARRLYRLSGRRAKVAIVMARKKLPCAEAQKRLKMKNQSLREALR